MTYIMLKLKIVETKWGWFSFSSLYVDCMNYNCHFCNFWLWLPCRAETTYFSKIQKCMLYFNKVPPPEGDADLECTKEIHWYFDVEISLKTKLCKANQPISLRPMSKLVYEPNVKSADGNHQTISYRFNLTYLLLCLY